MGYDNGSDGGTVKVERVGAFHLVTFNQPQIRNPLGPQVVVALNEALVAAEANSSVRAIAIRGHGPSFSSGGSLGNFEERLAMPLNPDGSDPIAASNRVFGAFLERLVRFPKPVVVAAHGAAMGGGAGLVCAADVALTCAGTRFSFTEASIGLLPAQIMPFVVARIGAQRALRLMLTAHRFDADEAFHLGVVDGVAPDMAALRNLLGDVLDGIGRCAPSALVRIKRLAKSCGSADWDAGDGLARLLDFGAQDFAAQMRGEGGEGVCAIRDKRDPSWRVTFDRTALAEW